MSMSSLLRIKPTDEQLHCVSIAKQMKDLRIEAFAGATKTTTLKLISQALSPKKGLYLAFSKQTVLSAKFPANVKARTFHSLAYSKTGKAFGARLDTRITGTLVAQTLGLSDFSGNGTKIMSAADLGAYLLATIDRFCCDMEPVLRMEHMPIPDLRSMEIKPELIRQFLWDNYQHQVQRLWALMSSPDGAFPTRHGVYLKLFALTSPVISGYDFIMFDEAQDADPLMLAVMACQRVPVFYVGDRFQQIFAWRGAVNAMDRIETANVAYLTQSFRFGKDLATMADMLLCAMGATQSIRGNDAVTTDLVELDRPTAVLCRTNASVSKYVMEAVKNGDTDFAATGIEDAVEFFESAVALKKGRSGKGKYKLFTSWGEMFAYAQTDDGADLANYVWMEREHGAEATLETLKKVASKQFDGAKRVISTAHRAKGLEWSEVMLADDFRGPSNPRFQEEDARLLYVAMTRAMHALDMTRVDEVYVDLLTHGANRIKTEETKPAIATPIVDVGTPTFSLTEPKVKPKSKVSLTAKPRRRASSGSWGRKRRSFGGKRGVRA